MQLRSIILDGEMDNRDKYIHIYIKREFINILTQKRSIVFVGTTRFFRVNIACT